MKPRIENTTKPAKKLVPLLIRAKTKASLQERRVHTYRAEARLNMKGRQSQNPHRRHLGRQDVLVAVVVEAVVAAQSGQSPQPDGVGEEDLCPGVYPHLCTGQRSQALEVFVAVSRA